MAYIRIKKINNSPYAYLVESENTKKGPRQKVKQYLGRVYGFEKVSDEKISTPVNSKQELLLNLVLSELKSRGFKEKEDVFSFNKIYFDPQTFAVSKRTNKKNVVVSLNEGFLCSYTLQNVLNFKKSRNLTKDGQILAKHFLDAGLQISEEDFVRFYDLI